MSDGLTHHRLRYDQLSEQVNETVEAFCADANRILRLHRAVLCSPVLNPQGVRHILHGNAVLANQQFAQLRFIRAGLLSCQCVIDLLRGHRSTFNQYLSQPLPGCPVFGAEGLLVFHRRLSQSLDPGEKNWECFVKGRCLPRLESRLEAAYHSPELVGSVENDIQICACQLNVPRAGASQQVLGFVRQRVDIVQLKATRHPLDRVERAENGVQTVLALRIHFQVQELHIHFVKMLARLGYKVRDERRISERIQRIRRGPVRYCLFVRLSITRTVQVR